ncbi:dynamin family protein, partial [Romboutsia sp.]|uniref:dynamin family protein n=1 Tax=Romboutsia sp. TaxID=1965302 RepID=UPI002C5FF2CE
MCASRHEELTKMMNIIDQLNQIIILCKRDFEYINKTKSTNLLNYIENQIKANVENIKELKNPFLLFIMGSGNYGKSTLINTLLKQNIVVTNDIPNTWKLDLFIKSNNEKMEIKYKDYSKITKSLQDGNKLLQKEEQKFKESKIKIAKSITNYKKMNKASVKKLKEYKKQQENMYLYKSDIVQIKYYLKKGDILKDFIIVDTPGLNQTLLKNTLDRMKEYYIKADGVIWLIDAQNIVSKENNKLIEEMNKIDSLHNNKKNIIAVVNKMDVISKENIDNIVKVRRKANEIYKDKFNDIVYISAKQAIEGILNDDYDLIHKSNINNLYKSIEEKFTKVCEQKQINSKYKNLFIMKDNIIKEIYYYKRELYKDISIYNEIEFELKQKTKEIYLYTLNHIEDIKKKNIYNGEDIDILKKDIEKLQTHCSLDLGKVYEVLFKKANLNKYKEIEKLNTNVYFARSKNLILDYYAQDIINKKNNKTANQLENIINKLTIKNSKKLYSDEILIKNHIDKKINDLKNEITKTLEDKIHSIEFNITKVRDENFKDKY